MRAASERVSSSLVRRAAGVLVVAALVAACGSSTASGSPETSVTGTPTPTATPTEAPTPTAAAPTEAASASSEPTGVPTSLDPCVVVTAADANALTGATFGAGAPSTTGGNGKLCTYTATGHVLTVALGVAPDVATAQSEEQSMKSQLEQTVPGVTFKVTELPGFVTGVDAAIVTGSASIGAQSFSATAMFMLKGTTFLGISDVALGGQAMSSDTIKAQAPTFLDRLP
jgi:hypothetical protein